MRTAVFLCAAFLLCNSNYLYEEGELWRVTVVARDHLITHAAIWHPSDISSINIALGPASSIAVPPESEISCEYVEPSGVQKGYTRKFRCRITSSQKVVRVKYSSNEAHAEAAGTRLLWVLGFYTDHVYPVRLKCLKCPEKDPWHPSSKEKRVDRMIEDAIIEENFSGKEIGTYPDQGWRWQELNLVKERSGAASRAEVDALKLLAVFLQHTDSKAEQQRLACYPQFIDHSMTRESCKKPVLMIQDLGETFGKGSTEITDFSAMNLEAWKSVPIWNDALERQTPHTCFGNLQAASFAKEDGLTNPKISEEGRVFLGNLLSQLSDAQIQELFEVARVNLLNQTIDDGGHKRRVTVQDWVSVFKDKRRQIHEHRCS